MRSSLFTAGLTAGIMLAGSAGAMTTQSAPVSGGGGTSHRLVDPDERTEQLVDQSQGNAIRGTYDRTSAASVMEFGNAPRGGSYPR
jgi:hypothetical protein